MTAQLLVVEDDTEFAELMAMWLRRAGHAVRIASSGPAAMRSLYQDRPDLVTLDVGLPRLDGWEVCRRIREVSSVPILIVSARGAEGDRVRGLELGADDYITKPFAFRELVARVSAVLRRASMAPTAPLAALRHRGLVIDRAAHRVMLEGVELHLTPTEYRVLLALAGRPGALVSHEQLLREAWGPGYDGELPLLRMVIRGLRAKLEASAPRSGYIGTEYGLGYRLTSDPATG